MSEWLDSITNIWNWSKTKVYADISDTTAAIETRSDNDSTKKFYHGSTLENCKKWADSLSNK